MGQDFDPNLRQCCNSLLEAANYLSYVQNKEPDDGLANYYYAKINELRDLAEALLPTEEDWGGSNVVPFVPRQRA